MKIKVAGSEGWMDCAQEERRKLINGACPGNGDILRWVKWWIAGAAIGVTFTALLVGR